MTNGHRRGHVLCYDSRRRWQTAAISHPKQRKPTRTGQGMGSKEHKLSSNMKAVTDAANQDDKK